MAASMQHILAPSCSAAAFPYPQLFGADFYSLSANLVSDFSHYVEQGRYVGHASMNITNLEFCNVTLTYTHPGQNDTIQTQVFLPMMEHWNGRMQGIGGGGWMAGMFELTNPSMIGAAGEGYVAVTTDGGHKSEITDDWALASPGNVNLYALQDLASVTLNDAAVIGKALAHSFYGRRPDYSYWSGCSQGGRQGLMLAQRYPTAYDGIHASAPAIYWTELLIGGYWPQLIMNRMGEHPRTCELDALTAAAIAACDDIDGVSDGMIALPELCHFDPSTQLDAKIPCPDAGHDVKISRAAVVAAQAAWQGARRRDGSFLWHGLNYEAELTGDIGIVNTNCSADEHCSGVPFSISDDWIRLFIKKDPTFDPRNITFEEYEDMFHASVQQYSSIIGTDDADLGAFRRAGGKMVTYHGLADSLISPRIMEQYYKSVTAMYPDVHSFYRLFESPGLGHCYFGKGAYPYTTFDSLVAWVENGTAPDSLVGETFKEAGTKKRRLLCPYPLKSRYDGKHDPDLETSYRCAW